MLDFAQRLIQWLDKRWRDAGWGVRILYAGLSLTLVVLLSLFIEAVPGFDRLKAIYAQAPPGVQLALLVVGAAVILVVAIWSLHKTDRVGRLEEENARLAARAAGAEAEARDYQQRHDHLMAVESREGLWRRPCQVAVPHFIPVGQRRTRFVTVLNFKGGVGKTTLTANLAAILALSPDARKVLLIDVDFQGTLGAATVDQSLHELQFRNDGYVSRLLLEEASPGLIDKIAVPMNQVPKARVILARDILDTAEFQLQARFFMEPTAEPRYQFRKHLQSAEVLENFDLVLIDCPPRVTTSVVNAVACSDYVLIPTRLDRGSVDAIPRTVTWMQGLGLHCQADVLGVVATQVAFHKGKMTNSDAKSYEYLAAVVKSVCGTDRLFRAVIPATPKAVVPELGLVAGLGPDGQQVFVPFVNEFMRRLKG